MFNEAGLIDVLGFRSEGPAKVPGFRFQISFGENFDKLDILDPSFLDVFLLSFSCKFPALAASGRWFVFIEAVDCCYYGCYY